MFNLKFNENLKFTVCECEYHLWTNWNAFTLRSSWEENVRMAIIGGFFSDCYCRLEIRKG